jgi:hypothetical protein
MFFWIVMLCGLIGRYQSFGKTYCLQTVFWVVALYCPDDGGSKDL